MIRTCALIGCDEEFETDGRKFYCSKYHAQVGWRSGRNTAPEPIRLGSRTERVTSGYSTSEHSDLAWLADEEGVSPGEMQRRIVVAHIRNA